MRVAIESRNPSTGELLAAFDPLDDAQLQSRLDRAVAAFGSWKQTSMAERSRLTNTVADLLEADADRLARIMTLEMGKLRRAAREEVLKCARACRFFAEHGAAFLADDEVRTDASRSYIRYEPLGVVLAIMPWNFPFWQVFRFAAPALVAGNVALLKHAPNVPQCALAIDELFTRAGFPGGVFQSLLIDVEQVPALLEDARVAAVTLTGSDRAGRDVAARAGRALKKSVLELGGSDPFIIMPSADQSNAIAVAITSRTLNAGQSCIAAKRFIVAKRVFEEFLQRFVEGMSALTVGDPLDDRTDVGPMARRDLVETLSAQVEDAVARGARVLTGGAPLDRAGHFYPPTVIVDIPRDSRTFREELFGPVAMVFRAEDVSEAIAIANDTRYGLAASVWTNDAAERERFVQELEVGQVFVNAMVASDPRVPFGGVKTSGYGRELGEHGIREFVNIKTVWIT